MVIKMSALRAAGRCLLQLRPPSGVVQLPVPETMDVGPRLGPDVWSPARRARFGVGQDGPYSRKDNGAPQGIWAKKPDGSLGPVRPGFASIDPTPTPFTKRLRFVPA